MENLTSTSARPIPADVANLRYLAARLGISEDTVYKLASSGRLTGIAFRVGRSWRVSIPALDRAIEAGTLDLAGGVP